MCRLCARSVLPHEVSCVFFLPRHEYLPPVTPRAVGPNWTDSEQRVRKVRREGRAGTEGRVGSGGDDGRSGGRSKGDES